MDEEKKMETINHYPVVVIGAGAGGLVVAIGAAKAGKKVLLIEKGPYGGDCTNFGCIPSKTLISCAEKGVEDPLDKVRSVVEEVRAHEDSQALEKMGVHTLTGVASFIDKHSIAVGDRKIYGEKIVLATGSHPFIPPIEGLKDAPYLTNETIFELKEIPKRLGILGAGPIGCELAQAFQRLGSNVTVIESERGIMPKEEGEAAEVVKKALEREGVQILLRCKANHISYQEGKFAICTLQDGKDISIEVDQLLVATGRRATLESLALETAGVVYSEKGIPIDKYGRTNQSHIFAIGDVVGGPFFTHLAENHGRTILTTLLLPGPFKKKLDLTQDIPRCTFTDPEVASFGMNEEEAIKKFGAKKITTYKVPMAEVDRAICTNRTEGFLKIVTKKWSSKILGATIVAPRAGEMLQELTVAKLFNISLRKLTRLIHPYPVYNAAIRKAADLWLTQTILGKKK